MKSCDSRFVLNRGLQELSNVDTEKGGAQIRMNEEDSRKIVNELAAAIRSEEPTFFLTLTLNQSRMFGVAPLYKIIQRNTEKMERGKRRIFIEGFMPLYMRLWERAATFLMKYIELSADKPLGTITNIFPRFEFQTSKGNAPHLHIILCTEEKKSDPLIRNKIAGSYRQLLHELGIEKEDIGNPKVENDKDINDLMDLAKATLSHSCEKADFRCHKKCDSSGTTVCRFKIFEPSNKTFFKLIERPHSEEAWEIFNELGLAKVVEGYQYLYEVSNELQGGKFNYAADFGETFSPVVTKIFTITQCSMNCLLCDTIMSAAYLAKYAAGVEEHAEVNIGGKSDDTVSVTVKRIKNIKIAGAQIAAKNEKELTSTSKCRILSSTECIWSILDLKYVFPTYTCVHVNTKPLENRGGFVRRKTHRRIVDRPGQYDPNFQFVNYRITLQLDTLRLFTGNQVRTVKEHVKSNLTIDKVSLFAVRPPELLFVNDLEFYFRHFSFTKIKESMLHESISPSLGESCWIDGVGNFVRLRGCSVESFKDLLSKRIDDSCNKYSFFASFYLDLFSRPDTVEFLIDNRPEFRKPAVVVFPNVIPKHSPNFLISLLLQFGRYETEFDLYEGGNIVSAYQAGGLIKDANSATIDEINSILRDFVLKRVVFVPGSHVSQDRQVIDAKLALSLLMNDNDDNIETPTIVYQALQEECNADLNQSVWNKFDKVKVQIHNLIRDGAKPSIEDLLHCNTDSPLSYNPLSSTDLNFNDEQQVVVSSLMKCVDISTSCSARFVKHLFVVGMPGSGKTFVITHLLLYVLCKGLNVMVTSLSSERSMQFSGIHIHDLFGLPVSTSNVVDQIVQKALHKLTFDTAKLTLLKRLDVIYFEEIGMICAEEFAAIDLILQSVRDSFLPFGGVLICATGDPKQLPPPQGRLIWTSPIMLTSVRMYALKDCVRMVDLVGRNFLNMLSSPKLTDEEIENILEVFKNNCNFCPLDDSPLDSVRIFATRAAEQKAIEHHIHRVSLSGLSVVDIDSNDEMKSNPSSNWKCFTNKKILNRLCLEPEKLFCYENALMRITCNLPIMNVSQGQMCVFKSFDGANKIEVIVAPPGVRKLPSLNALGQYGFIENGWFELVLHKQAGFVHSYKGSSLRRTQFPLKNFMAMTIHKAMGETIGKIVTKIDCFEREYCLWEKEQLYVLVSRVQNLNDLTFLGDKETTITSIKRLLGQTAQWDEYTEKLVETACNQAPVVFDLANTCPFRPRKVDIPPGDVGFVYLLVSTKDISVSYVGETCNIKRRLREHNSGDGSFLTNKRHLRPWGVLCFATGFSDDDCTNQIQRKRLESNIHEKMFLLLNVHNGYGAPSQVLEIFIKCVQDFNVECEGLRVVVTGKIVQ